MVPSSFACTWAMLFRTMVIMVIPLMMMSSAAIVITNTVAEAAHAPPPPSPPRYLRALQQSSRAKLGGGGAPNRDTIGAIQQASTLARDPNIQVGRDPTMQVGSSSSAASSSTSTSFDRTPQATTVATTHISNDEDENTNSPENIFEKDHGTTNSNNNIPWDDPTASISSALESKNTSKNTAANDREHLKIVNTNDGNSSDSNTSVDDANSENVAENNHRNRRNIVWGTLGGVMAVLLLFGMGYLVQRRYCGPSRLEEAKAEEAGQEAARGIIKQPQPLSTTILVVGEGEGENDVTYCEEYEEEADEAASGVEPEEQQEEDYATHTRRAYDTKQTLEEKMRTFRPRFRRRNLMKPHTSSVAMADREDFE